MYKFLLYEHGLTEWKLKNESGRMEFMEVVDLKLWTLQYDLCTTCALRQTLRASCLSGQAMATR